jgi:transglutaminase-like putative cysteine protease
MRRLADRTLEWLTVRGIVIFALTAAVLAAVVSWTAPLIFRSDSVLFLLAVLAGLAAGWAMGRLPLPPWAAGAAASALGMDFLFFAIARLDVPLRSWIEHSIPGILHLLPQFRDLHFDAGLWLVDSQRILLGPVSVVVRFQKWALTVVRGGEYFDPVASALLWSLVFCLAGAFAGWAVSACSKPLTGILPAVLVMGAVFAFVGGDWHSVVLAGGLVFILTATVEHSQKELEWERNRMGYSTALRWDLLFSTAPVVAVLVTGAYILPSISLDEITRWVREHTQPTAAPSGTTGQSFGLNPVTGRGADPSEMRIFPRSHFLGAGPDLSHDVALVIVTGESLMYLPGVREPAAPRHYWKAMTYDLYSGGGWLTSPTEDQELLPEAVIHEDLPQGILLHQTVTVNRAGMGPLYAAGEWVKVYQIFRLVWRTHEDILGILIPGSAYEVDSVYLRTDEAALRAAGTDYPDWIRDRYLQLPNILPRRVHSLARDLTAAPLTPYDRALAIQSYLRSEMSYTLEIGAPPYDRDVVDYFLFDSKKGFCDYYASAMVVLARSAGIPARLAIGFASGTFDPALGRFTVLESDAHAWPELYFPGIGWVEFEPTSSMPVFQRSAASEAPAAGPVPQQETNPRLSAVLDAAASVLRRMALPALILLAALPVLLAAWILLAPVRLMLLPPAPAVRAAYRGLVAHGRRQGISFSPATTPAEFTQRLARRHPADGLPLRRMADLYSRLVYGGKAVSRRQKREAVGEWFRLDRRMWWAWWKSRLRMFMGRKMRRGQAGGENDSHCQPAAE